MKEIRIKPNAEGKIPCICCDHNGQRKNMITKHVRTCEYCNGTKMRAAPNGYVWEEPKKSLTQFVTFVGSYKHEMTYENGVVRVVCSDYRYEFSAEELVEDLKLCDEFEETVK